MDRAEVRSMLQACSEEIQDHEGTVIGSVQQPARFKLNRPYLAMGGFLVVDCDEATGVYAGTEFDALPHPKSGQPYPAGHSERVWQVPTLDEAFIRVMAALSETGVE